MQCKICGRDHEHSEDSCKEITQRGVQTELSRVLERVIDKYGDTNAVRLMIANYTVGYTGADFGLHIPQ